jgi:hypothetical protein
MRGEQKGRAAQAAWGAAALLSLTLAGCGTSGTGSSGNLFSGSALDLFSTSSKASATKPATAGAAAAETTTDIECPEVQVRTGAATLIIGSKPKDPEPAALDVRYQGTIIRTARECHVNAGVMTMKVGIEGRIITGPAGGPGTVDAPLRIAVVQEGVTPKPIVSKFGLEKVTIASAVDRVAFTHIDPDISFPLPQPLANIDAYVVYVGFDPLGAQPEKKKPAVRRKPAAKPKPAAQAR